MELTSKHKINFNSIKGRAKQYSTGKECYFTREAIWNWFPAGTDAQVHADSWHPAIHTQQCEALQQIQVILFSLFLLFLAMDIVAKPQSGKDVSDAHWQGQTTRRAGRACVRSICSGIYTNYLAGHGKYHSNFGSDCFQIARWKLRDFDHLLFTKIFWLLLLNTDLATETHTSGTNRHSRWGWINSFSSVTHTNGVIKLCLLRTAV